MVIIAFSHNLASRPTLSRLRNTSWRVKHWNAWTVCSCYEKGLSRRGNNPRKKYLPSSEVVFRSGNKCKLTCRFHLNSALRLLVRVVEALYSSFQFSVRWGLQMRIARDCHSGCHGDRTVDVNFDIHWRGRSEEGWGYGLPTLLFNGAASSIIRARASVHLFS